MREALRGGGGWADNKGHWKCVLHSFTPPLKQAAMHSAPDHVIERQRRTTENTPTPPGTLSPLNGRTPFPHPLQGQPLPAAGVFQRRDAHAGADLERAGPIDGIKLPVKERNQYVFKGEAGCMWRACGLH